MDPDRDLVLACQSGRTEDFERAFELLFERYRDRVFSIAFRITGSVNDALDVVQESFSALFRKIGSFRADSLFSTWMFRIVVNCSIDMRRRERSRFRLSGRPLPPGAGEIADAADGPFERAQASELGSHVQSCIQQLSPKLRAILVLRYLEGMSYEELSTTLRLSMGTVKSRLARAHIALERVLRGTLEPFGVPEGGLVKEDEPAAEAGGGAA